MFVFLYPCLFRVVFECFRDSVTIISNVSLLEMELGLDVCIGLLSLCNKLLQNLELKTTNMYYIAPFLRVRNPGAA